MLEVRSLTCFESFEPKIKVLAGLRSSRRPQEGICFLVLSVCLLDAVCIPWLMVPPPSSERINPVSASAVTSPFLTLTVLPPSYKSPCDDERPT